MPDPVREETGAAVERAVEMALTGNLGLRCSVCLVDYVEVPAGGRCQEYLPRATDEQIIERRAPLCPGTVEFGPLEGAAKRIARAALAASVSFSQQKRQEAIDKAYGVMSASAYVGGPSEGEAWQTAMAALAPFVTQHIGQEAPDA